MKVHMCARMYIGMCIHGYRKLFYIQCGVDGLLVRMCTYVRKQRGLTAFMEMMQHMFVLRH